MEEQLISFETAKLATEKGFTRRTMGYSMTSTRNNYYTENGELNGDCTDFIKEVIRAPRKKKEKIRLNHILYPASTQSLLQKWLREKHGEHIGVTYMTGSKTYNTSLTMRSMGWSGFKSYEEALEKGLQEALKLI